MQNLRNRCFFDPRSGSEISILRITDPYFSELCKYFVDEIFEFSVDRLK
jgi:hypothetical protein